MIREKVPSSEQNQEVKIPPIVKIEGEQALRAREILLKEYLGILHAEGSPVTEGLVRLNMEHADRVYQNAIEIARGEGLDENTLGTAALLHDVAKLSNKEKSGIDTFYHHEHGAPIAKEKLGKDLGIDDATAETIANAIHRHSDIPFIRRFLEQQGQEVPTPEAPLDFALRDADTIDQLEVGGMHKIVHFRQNPQTPFYKEDGGDVQKAIASARKSFEEAYGVISTRTGREIAQRQIQKAKPFFDALKEVKTLEGFDKAYEKFISTGKA